MCKQYQNNIPFKVHKFGVEPVQASHCSGHLDIVLESIKYLGKGLIQSAKLLPKQVWQLGKHG